MTTLAGISASWTRSIRWKMVGVLVAISVIPMLILTDIATQLVASTFQKDVEFWLFQTSRYFVAEIIDDERESGEIASMLVENGSLDALLAGSSQGVPRNITRMIDTLGFDLLVISEGDRVLYSSAPVDSLTAVPFADGHTIYLLHDRGTTTLMAGGAHRFDRGGRAYRVLLGTLIDEDFTNNLNNMVSLELRLYYQIDGHFVQFYTSQKHPPEAVPASAVAALEAGAANAYISAENSGDDQSFGIYAPIRAKGTLVGIVFCGVTSKAGLAHWLTRENLFIGIFAFVMLLSVGAGLMMSQFLTRPLARLANAVNAITGGDFTQRVSVGRKDELGQLAVAFNSMAQRLEGLRKIEAKLRRRERMTTLGEVAAGLAHEIRNPLGIIKTSAELLMQSPNVTEEDARRLGYVVDESRRIEQLVRDFLVFAKPPRRTAEILPVDLVKHVLGICQSEIERRGTEVRIEDESGDSKIYLDVDQMIQACLNLVLNALQAMDSAPHAGCTTSAAAPPTLNIQITASDDDIHLVFADNGPGVPPHLVDRIFDPFVTTKAAGTGLGLARVFAVAEGHGGWVEARNGADGGAIFELVIPRSDRRADDVPHDSDR